MQHDLSLYAHKSIKEIDKKVGHATALVIFYVLGTYEKYGMNSQNFLSHGQKGTYHIIISKQKIIMVEKWVCEVS